ncbi:MAG: hypothetical protein ACLFPS_00935 [Clostridia bacterium]
MESTRVFLRGLNARIAIERYDGPLYYALFPRALKYMCKWETGEKEDFETMEQWLSMNNITEQENDILYPKIPLLTADVAKEYQKRITAELKDDLCGLEHIRKIKDKFENWDEVGYNFVSQIILGVLWFNAWMKSSDHPDEPAALIITDIDLSPVFINGIVPLKGNEIISYWQTNQLGHPDTLNDTLNDKAVIKSLESINQDYTFTAYENALVLLNRLKAYKTKTGDANIAVPYIDLPKITLEDVKKCKTELSDLTKHFISKIEKLDKIAREFYENRQAILKKIDYHNYRNMIFLVYKYCVIDEYNKNEIFIEGKLAKDTKKIKPSPQWTML